MSHRMHTTWIGGIFRGGIHVVTAYLKDSQGLSETNLALLAELAAHMATLRGPWIVVADWNMAPELLDRSGWPRVVGGRILATREATCGAQVYDYAVAAHAWPADDIHILRLNDTSFHPHWAIRLLISGAARRKAVRKLIRPTRIDAQAIAGPQLQVPLLWESGKRWRAPPDDGSHAETPFTGVVGSGARACDIGAWYAAVRGHWYTYGVGQLNERAPYFRWEPAAGKIACPSPGAFAATACLRSIYKVTKEAPDVSDDARRRSACTLHARTCNVTKLMQTAAELAHAKPIRKCQDINRAVLRQLVTRATQALANRVRALLFVLQNKIRHLESKAAMQLPARGELR